MNCPTCQGHGELEIDCENEKQHQFEEKVLILARERASWPYTCPKCGGSGYLEENF